MQLTLDNLVKPFKWPATPHEYRVTALRECPLPESQVDCSTPDDAANYWRTHVVKHPNYNSEVETMVVLMLNTRKKIKGHYLVATGTLDTILCSPREIFRVAIMTSAACIVAMHNHPSGDPSPSAADIKVTRDLRRAGELLKIELLDHVIVGAATHHSLRELGHFL